MRLRQTYNENSTFSKDKQLPNIEDPIYKFKSVDFSQKYGFRSMVPRAFLKFTERLEKGGRDQLITYLTDKAGFDSEWSVHRDLIMKIYTEDGLLADPETDFLRMICILSEGLTTLEVINCWDRKMKEKGLSIPLKYQQMLLKSESL